MHFSSILPVLAALGGINAAAIETDNNLMERAPTGIPLLKLTGVTRNPTSTFTGVGLPGACNALPANINTFKDATNIVKCFQCSVYTGRGCTGDVFTVGPQPQAFKQGQRPPTFKSWRCGCPS